MGSCLKRAMTLSAHRQIDVLPWKRYKTESSLTRFDRPLSSSFSSLLHLSRRVTHFQKGLQDKPTDEVEFGIFVSLFTMSRNFFFRKCALFVDMACIGARLADNPESPARAVTTPKPRLIQSRSTQRTEALSQSNAESNLVASSPSQHDAGSNLLLKRGGACPVTASENLWLEGTGNL